jgi:hypothetical protein
MTLSSEQQVKKILQQKFILEHVHDGLAKWCLITIDLSHRRERHVCSNHEAASAAGPLRFWRMLSGPQQLKPRASGTC